MSEAAISVNAAGTSITGCHIQGNNMSTLQSSSSVFDVGDGKSSTFVFHVAKKHPSVKVFERTYEEDAAYQGLTIDNNGLSGKKLEVLKPVYVDVYDWELSDGQLSVFFDKAPMRKQYVLVIE